MSKQAKYQVFVGIDISAMTVSVAWGPDKEQIGKAQEFEQTRGGRKGIIKRLRASGHKPCEILVVIEATGTYWMQVASVRSYW